MSTNADTTAGDGIEVPSNPPERVDGINLVPEPTWDWLNGPQRDDYRRHRYPMIKWLLERGKNPDRDDGYASSTARVRASRIDQFYRWVWEREGRYTTRVTSDHADQYVKHLIRTADTEQDDRANKQKALISLFDWRARRFGDDPWEPDDEWREHNAGEKDQPYFMDQERSLLRDAVLDFRSVPHYNSLDPDERDEMKADLAQRFEKPKREVTPEDFGSVPTRKYASLIHATLDLGLRPCEVAEFRVDWFDPENDLVIIPEEHSRKTYEVRILDGPIKEAVEFAREKQREADATDTDQSGGSEAVDPLDRIEKLQELADEGAITEEEFEKKEAGTTGSGIDHFHPNFLPAFDLRHSYVRQTSISNTFVSCGNTRPICEFNGEEKQFHCGL